MKTAITVILIIVAVAAVLFFLPLIIMFFSYVFGIRDFGKIKNKSRDFLVTTGLTD